MNKDEIQKLINSLTVISNKRNYWFVRTQGGDFYETFLLNNYIAIGYDENIFIVKQNQLTNIN